MSNQILNIDYQTIVNKLQELKESIPLIDVDLDSSLDSKSYEFLEFIDRTIKLAHELDIANSINTARSIEQLLNDAKPLFDIIIDRCSDNNELISYYEDLLKEHFKNIQSKLSSMQDNMVEFDLSLATLKLNLLLEDLSAIDKKTTDNSKDILDQFANELVDKFKDNETTSDALDSAIEKVFKENDDKIHSKLSEVFSKVSSNIGAKVKAKIDAKYNFVFKNNIIRHFDPKKRSAFQRGLAKIKRRIGILATPITIISKFSKHLKRNVKANIKRQQVKMAVKSNLEVFAKYGLAGVIVKNIIPGFRRKKEEEKKEEENKKEKKQSHLDKFLTTSNKDIFLKHGIAGLLAKQVLKIFHKPKLEVDDDKSSTTVIRKYDFNPFVVSDRRILNSIPKMIGKVYEFAQIVKTNIKNYFEIKDDEIEEYDSVKESKKKGLFSFLKKDEKKEAKVKSGGGGLLSMVFGSLLTKAFKPLKGFLAKTMKKLAIKSGRWAMSGIRYGYDSLRHGTAYAKHMKIVRARAQHISDIRKARQAQDALKAGKTVTKTSLRSAAKSYAILAFATDAVIGFVEAQDKKLMGQVFGMAQSEIGVQQQASYVLSSTLAGNESLFDTDWSSGASIASGVLGTLGTTAKWAAVGALVGGPIGAAVGAAVGLVVALIGTSRIARFFNWACNGIKKLWFGYWRFNAFIFTKSVEVYFTIIQDIWSGVKWLFKKIASWFEKSDKAKVVLDKKIKKLDMHGLLNKEQRALKARKENKQLEVFDSLNSGITRIDQLAHELIDLMKNMRNTPAIANDERLTLRDLQQAIINGRQNEVKQLAVALNGNKPKSILQNAKEHWNNESELEEFRQWQAARGFA